MRSSYLSKPDISHERLDTFKTVESLSPKKRPQPIYIPKDDPPKSKTPIPQANRKISPKRCISSPEELINKYQLSLAKYIKKNKDYIRLSGTKRFLGKSGEYYLKNVLLEKKNQQKKFMKKLSLSQPQSIMTCMDKLRGIKKLEERADNLVTKLPENSLTPIPIMIEKQFRCNNDILLLEKAERTAVHIRRMEYSTGIKNRKKQSGISKTELRNLKKIIFIQNWWKTLYKIIKIQKCFKGYSFRKQLMTELENQEIMINSLFFIDDLYKKFYYKKFIKNFRKIYQVKVLYQLINTLDTHQIHQKFKKWKKVNKFQREFELLQSSNLKKLTIQTSTNFVIDSESGRASLQLSPKKFTIETSNNFVLDSPSKLKCSTGIFEIESPHQLSITNPIQKTVYKKNKPIDNYTFQNRKSFDKQEQSVQTPKQHTIEIIEKTIPAKTEYQIQSLSFNCVNPEQEKENMNKVNPPIKKDESKNKIKVLRKTKTPLNSNNFSRTCSKNLFTPKTKKTMDNEIFRSHRKENYVCSSGILSCDFLFLWCP